MRARNLFTAAILSVTPISVALGAAAPNDPIEIDMTTLTEFEYEEGMELPEKVAELDGLRVVFEGYMHSETKEDTTTFLVVGDACQCAGTPLINHFVEITLDSGTTSHRPGLITFEGALSVSEEYDDLGLVETLYRLDGNFF